MDFWGGCTISFTWLTYHFEITVFLLWFYSCHHTGVAYAPADHNSFQAMTLKYSWAHLNKSPIGKGGQKETRVSSLTLLLTGEVQHAYYALPDNEAADYTILHMPPGDGSTTAMSPINLTLESDRLLSAEITERVAMDCFLRSYLRCWKSMRSNNILHPAVYPVPENITSPTYSSAHHQCSLWIHGHGPGRTTWKGCLWSQVCAGSGGNKIPQSHPLLQGHPRKHYTGTGSPLQLSGDS